MSAERCHRHAVFLESLRRPRAGVLNASARVLKQGWHLVVGEVEVSHEGDDDGPVAHAVMTYSVPPG